MFLAVYFFPNYGIPFILHKHKLLLLIHYLTEFEQKRRKSWGTFLFFRHPGRRPRARRGRRRRARRRPPTRQRARPNGRPRPRASRRQVLRVGARGRAAARRDRTPGRGRRLVRLRVPRRRRRQDHRVARRHGCRGRRRTGANAVSPVRRGEGAPRTRRDDRRRLSSSSWVPVKGKSPSLSYPMEKRRS